MTATKLTLANFNKDLLLNMIEEHTKSLKRALEQHLLLSNQLRELKVRFQRASNSSQKPHAYNHSMKIASVSGTICMYEEYMKRKAEQVRRLRLYLQRITILENQQAIAQQNIKQTTPNSNSLLREDNSNNIKDDTLQSKKIAKPVTETDKYQSTESHEDCEASIPSPISAYESRGSDLTKAETSSQYARGTKRSLGDAKYDDNNTCLKVKR